MNTLDEKILSKLIEARAESLDSTQLYLSLYYPTQNSQLDLKKKIKSTLLHCLRDYEEIKENSNLHEQIVAVVIEKINALTELKAGVAVFLKFNSAESARAHFTKTLESSIHIFVLDTPLEEEAYLGKIYKLDQLICLSDYQRKCIVMSLNQEETQLYQLTAKGTSQIRVFENEYRNEQPGEYLEKHSPTREDKTYHGTGNDVAQRRNTTDNRLFLNEILEYLEDYYQNRWQYDFIVCFYSEQFKGLVQKLEEEFSNTHQLKKIITIQKNYNLKNSLEADAREAINAFEIKEKRDRIKELEEKKLMEYGWARILTASRKSKIEQLFIRMKVKHSGYILDNAHPFSHSVKNSRKVTDVVPWLVNEVAKNGGKVVCLSDEVNLMKDQQVGAELRY